VKNVGLVNLNANLPAKRKNDPTELETKIYSNKV
jgi:hypothetical protein